MKTTLMLSIVLSLLGGGFVLGLAFAYSIYRRYNAIVGSFKEPTDNIDRQVVSDD